jgi:hypothetical protein
VTQRVIRVCVGGVRALLRVIEFLFWGFCLGFGCVVFGGAFVNFGVF